MSGELILVQNSLRILVPWPAAFDLQQTYDHIEAATLHRLNDGSALKQSRWAKTKTTLNGSGRTPAAFDRIDYAEPFDLWCVASKVLDSTATQIALPAAYRTDMALKAYAYIGELLVATSLTVDAGVATVAAVSGADHYRIHYYPILTVYAERPRQDGDDTSATYSWELTAEEI